MRKQLGERSREHQLKHQITPSPLRGQFGCVSGRSLVGGGVLLPGGGRSVGDPLVEAGGEGADLLRLDRPAVPLADLRVHALLGAEELADGAGVGVDLRSELLGREGGCHDDFPFVGVEAICPLVDMTNIPPPSPCVKAFAL